MSVNVGTAVAYLDLDTTKFTSGISSALLQLKSITDSSATTTTKLTALSSAMSSAGSSLTKYVTAPIAGLGTAATKLASDFEGSMSKVQAISGSNVDQMEALTDKPSRWVLKRNSPPKNPQMLSLIWQWLDGKQKK